MALITQPGAYADIQAEDYHGNPDLLPEHSLSSSGAKTLLKKSAYHYWAGSTLNPDRPTVEKKHFSVGRAAHDLILLPDRFSEFYHVVPDGFSRAATKKFADEIALADEAIAAGLTVLTQTDLAVVESVAAALKRNELAYAVLTNGVPEETLVWQDGVTGRWMRARPDYRPNSILQKRSVMIVPDLKFVAAEHASPEGFSRMVDKYGYHQSAAHYADGIKAVYGHYPTHWIHIVVEKDYPNCVALYELPGEDIERGRVLNRRAINLFDRCMSTGHWPGYADQPKQVGLTSWARRSIDDMTPEELAFAASA